jgi:hypothetical protein
MRHSAYRDVPDCPRRPGRGFVVLRTVCGRRTRVPGMSAHGSGGLVARVIRIEAPIVLGANHIGVFP